MNLDFPISLFYIGITIRRVPKSTVMFSACCGMSPGSRRAIFLIGVYPGRRCSRIILRWHSSRCCPTSCLTVRLPRQGRYPCLCPVQQNCVTNNLDCSPCASPTNRCTCDVAPDLVQTWTLPEEQALATREYEGWIVSSKRNKSETVASTALEQQRSSRPFLDALVADTCHRSMSNITMSEVEDDEIELLHWGILGTGCYAKCFVGNLNYHMGKEDPNGPHHALVGVASSRSEDMAKELLDSFDVPDCTLTFRDYSELVHSSLIDVVFIATPHSHHFQNALLALEAGKHVVCQKSLTVNAAQAKKLFEIAQRKQLFLMEGWWLWWPQASRKTCQLLREGEIGEVNRIVANFGIRNNYCMFRSESGRLTSKELAGGALLELGSLALHWILRALPGGASRPTQVTSTMKKYPKSGVDETTTVEMIFSTGVREIHAKASASLSTAAGSDGQLAYVIIEGSNGKIEIHGWETTPTELYVFKNRHSLSEPYRETLQEAEPLFIPEADEVARCIREELLESPEMPWAESLLVMEIMDLVRKQNDLHYPPQIETSEPSISPLSIPLWGWLSSTGHQV